MIIIPPAIGGNVADGKGSDIATSMAVIQSKMVNLKEKVNVYTCTCILKYQSYHFKIFNV